MTIPAYDQLGKDLERALEAAAREASIAAAGWAKDAAASTVDAAGHIGRVDTGEYVKAITATPPVDRGAFWEAFVIVRPPRSEIAPVIEYGRRPGRPISQRGMLNLQRWVVLNLANLELAQLPGAKAHTRVISGKSYVSRVTGVKPADRDETVRRITYLVARKIRRKGTPGIHPMGTARARLEGPEGSAIIGEALARFMGGTA